MPNKGLPVENNTKTNNNNIHDLKTSAVKFTPFTSALDRSRLRTGAQSVIKSATEVF